MGEKSLPKNWVETELGKVTEIVTGNTPSKAHNEYYGGNIPWVKPGDINKATYVIETEECLSLLGFHKARQLPKGAIMVTCIGNLGNTAIAGTDLATNQQINSIVIKHELLNKKFVYYYSRTLQSWLVENSTSTTISMVNKTNFEKAPITFPPLAEQERIVKKLDALFDQLDGIRASMDKIPQLLKDFRQQVLTQAVTGKLTEEWRKGKELEEWREDKLENLAIFKSGFAFKSSDFVNEGIQLVRMGNLYNNILDLNRNPIFLPLNYSKELIEKYLIKEGDILLSLTGTKYKRDYGFAIRINTKENLLLNQRILSLTAIPSKIESSFLMYLLRGDNFRDQFFSFETGGVNQGNVGVKNVATINIYIPPLQEQEEIVRRVESLFSQADAIEQQYAKLKEKIDTLPQAILHKAFKGELVEQLPTDGDARDLLKQIEKLQKQTKKKN